VTEAGENDRSRGTREPLGKDQSFPPIPRKAPRFIEAIKAHFREVVKAVTHRIPGPAQRRRRRGENTGRGFRLSARKLLRRATESMRTPWDALRGALEVADDRRNNAPSLVTAPQENDGPMSAAELIAWYLDNGYTMQAVRTMFPALFQEDPAQSEPSRGAPEFHEPELWQWNTPPDIENAFDDFQHAGQNGFHPHL